MITWHLISDYLLHTMCGELTDGLSPFSKLILTWKVKFDECALLSVLPSPLFANIALLSFGMQPPSLPFLKAFLFYILTSNCLWQGWSWWNSSASFPRHQCPKRLRISQCPWKASGVQIYKALQFNVVCNEDEDGKMFNMEQGFFVEGKKKLIWNTSALKAMCLWAKTCGQYNLWFLSLQIWKQVCRCQGTPFYSNELFVLRPTQSWNLNNLFPVSGVVLKWFLARGVL